MSVATKQQKDTESQNAWLAPRGSECSNPLAVGELFMLILQQSAR